MSTFQEKYNQSISQEEKELLLKSGVRAVLNKEKRKQWEQELREDYNVSKGTGAIKKGRVVYMKYYKAIAVAASLAIIMYASQGLFYNQSSPSEMAMTYLESDPIQHPGLTKGAEEVEVFRQVAIGAFDERNYADAIIQFNQIENPTAEDRYFLSLSYLYNQDYNRAVEGFDYLEKEGSIYNQEINWYQSIALILKGDPAKAKAVLEKIGKSDWNYNKARELINAM